MPNITITEKRQLTEIAEREGWAIATGSIVLERCEFTGDELERRGDFMAFISGGVRNNVVEAEFDADGLVLSGKITEYLQELEGGRLVNKRQNTERTESFRSVREWLSTRCW